MKKLLLLLVIVSSCIQPAMAWPNATTVYKAYHYGVHYPIVGITFLMHIPTFVLRYADKCADKALYARTK